MVPRPPNSTRTDTLIAYTTLCRSLTPAPPTGSLHPIPCTVRQPWRGPCGLMRVQDSYRFNHISQGDPKRCGNSQALLQLSLSAWPPSWPPPPWRRIPPRKSEERRVGKEWFSTVRSRGSPYPSNKNIKL